MLVRRAYWSAYAGEKSLLTSAYAGEKSLLECL